MPIFSSLVSTVMLLGVAALIQNQLPVWSSLSTLDHCRAIIAAMIAVAVAFSGWLYVATRRVAAAVVHGLIMAVIGGFGSYQGIRILADHSIAGGHGPDANSIAGVVYGINLLIAFVGAATLLCGVLVIRSAFNAPSRNPTIA